MKTIISIAVIVLISGWCYQIKQSVDELTTLTRDHIAATVYIHEDMQPMVTYFEKHDALYEKALEMTSRRER